MAELFDGDMKGEVWKEIPWTESRYEVSNKGRVRYLRGTKLYLSKIGRNGTIYITKYGGHITRKSVGRLVLEAFVGYPKILNKNVQCRHINGVSVDNRIENLEWLDDE